jgi:hypothetical protein
MINSFTNRCVRDLAWVIASPPLVSGVFHNNHQTTQWWDHVKCQQEWVDCLPALQALDQNPQALLAHLERLNSKRLGLRFEAFIAFWLLSISPNFKLLAQNIQLNAIAGDTRSRTLGEVDFIIEEVLSGKIIHLEVAVKFYLGTAPFDDPYRWFGTNTQDQLGKKVKHLQQHQTQLLLHHAEQLPFAIDERHCVLKGRLFYPLAFPSRQTPAVLPAYVTATHLYGRYIFYDGTQSTNKRLIQLEKNQWLATLTHNDIIAKKCQSNYSVAARASCYALLQKNKQGEEEESERIFCLPRGFFFPSALSGE